MYRSSVHGFHAKLRECVRWLGVVEQVTANVAVKQIQNNVAKQKHQKVAKAHNPSGLRADVALKSECKGIGRKQKRASKQHAYHPQPSLAGKTAVKAQTNSRYQTENASPRQQSDVNGS